ncbi:MAG: hypothetical protein ABJB33_08780 [Gemmatimonadota bacterium]
MLWRLEAPPPPPPPPPNPHRLELRGWEVIDKLLAEHEIFRNDRFLLQFEVGVMPQRELLRAIELDGTVVAPAVRKATAA